MTFVSYVGTPEDWAAERSALIGQHNLAVVDHDNMLAGRCFCRFATVGKAPVVASVSINTEGRICPSCGNANFVRTGACMTCADCGTSDGCG